MFVVSDEDDIDGMQDAGVALVRAYNYISEEVDSQAAFDGVITVRSSESEELKLFCKNVDTIRDETSLLLSASACFSPDVQPSAGWWKVEC